MLNPVKMNKGLARRIRNTLGDQFSIIVKVSKATHFNEAAQAFKILGFSKVQRTLKRNTVLYTHSVNETIYLRLTKQDVYFSSDEGIAPYIGNPRVYTVPSLFEFNLNELEKITKRYTLNQKLKR